MGAVLVYVACFMIVGGLQVITSRMLDVRRTFVVGIALIFGLSVEMVPELYRQVPNSVSPLFLVRVVTRHSSSGHTESTVSSRSGENQDRSAHSR
jgi:xanthine/uracil permease